MTARRASSPGTWTCPCHGRPFIHLPLVVEYTNAQLKFAWDAAYKMRDMYDHKTEMHRGRGSTYESDPNRTWRGVLAEKVLSDQLQVPMTVYQGPDECEKCGLGTKVTTPYDVWPDIELRSVRDRPNKPEWLKLDLYQRGDTAKLRRRNWVLCAVNDRQVRYLGYRHGSDIERLDYEEQRPGRTVKLINSLYPDELMDMSVLVAQTAQLRRDRLSDSR